MTKTKKVPLYPVNLFRDHLDAAESDQLIAIWAGAYVDSLIDSLLRARLVRDSRTDEMLDRTPLAQRIDLAFAVGMLTEGVRTDLRTIAKIRNHFAHSLADG